MRNAAIRLQVHWEKYTESSQLKTLDHEVQGSLDSIVNSIAAEGT